MWGGRFQPQIVSNLWVILRNVRFALQTDYRKHRIAARQKCKWFDDTRRLNWFAVKKRANEEGSASPRHTMIAIVIVQSYFLSFVQHALLANVLRFHRQRTLKESTIDTRLFDRDTYDVCAQTWLECMWDLISSPCWTSLDDNNVQQNVGTHGLLATCS